MVSTVEQGNRAVEAERQAHKQQVSNNQADWDRYVDSRIALYLNTHPVGDDSALPDALHEALGQILAEERRQWQRERALIQSEAQRVISDLRATISELAGEIRQKSMDIKARRVSLARQALRDRPANCRSLGDSSPAGFTMREIA